MSDEKKDGLKNSSPESPDMEQESQSADRQEELWAKIRKIVTGEVFTYLFFGVCTTVVNIVVFQLCCSAMGIHALISNIIAWIFAVAFAYITNRIFVFHSKENSLGGVLREAGSFVGARLFSLLVDEFIIWLMVDVMGYIAIERLLAGILHCPLKDAKSLFAKLCSNVVVVIMNYVLSKLIIFRKGE